MSGESVTPVLQKQRTIIVCHLQTDVNTHNNTSILSNGFQHFLDYKLSASRVENWWLKVSRKSHGRARKLVVITQSSPQQLYTKLVPILFPYLSTKQSLKWQVHTVAAVMEGNVVSQNRRSGELVYQVISTIIYSLSNTLRAAPTSLSRDPFSPLTGVKVTQICQPVLISAENQQIWR